MCYINAQMVGITTTIENPRLIMNPSISICARGESISTFFYNWEYYYQGSSGPTPRPKEMLDSFIYSSYINESTRYNSDSGLWVIAVLFFTSTVARFCTKFF